MQRRLKSFTKMFFRRRDNRMQTSRVRPTSKSPTKNSRRHVISAKNTRDSDDSDITITHKSSTSSTMSTSSSSSTRTSTHTSHPEKLCCDKCDGKHETDKCPYYKSKRGKHPDEQKNFYKKLGGVSNLPGQTLRSARVVRQPGDGSCLFHSMSYGAFFYCCGP